MSRENSGDDHFDLESQSHLLVKDGGDNSTTSTSGPSHRWRSIIIILHVRQVFISSARNKSLAVDGIAVVPPPPSIATSNTGGDGDGGGDGLNVELAIISTSPEVSLDVQSDGIDESNKCNKELQNAEIARIVKAKDLNSLREFGGVQGFAEALDTDLENGLANDEDDICCRRLTCPQFETKAPQEGFFHIVWNVCNKYLIFLFFLCAVLSIVFGILEEGLHTGWHKGTFIFCAIINVELAIISTSPEVSLDVQSDGTDEGNQCNKELQNAEIARIVKAKDLNSLREFGGVQGFAEALDTDLENGLANDEDDICCRRLTCPQSETKAPQEGFFHIVWNNVELAVILTSPEVSLDVQSDGTNESNKCNKVLQNAEIARIVKAKDLDSLREFGGVQGFEEALDTDLENGLANDEDDICCRGLTCPQSETKAPQEGFFHIVWNNVELVVILTSPEESLDVQSDGTNESNKCNKVLRNAEIARIVKAKDLNTLREFGGVQGFAEALDTDLENGLANDEDDICCRRLTCPQSETKAPQEGFFHIVWNVSLDVQSDGTDEGNQCNKELQNAEIARIVKAKDLNSLREFGGVQGFAEALDTDLENGLANDEDDICCRRLTCPQFETKASQEGFFRIVWNPRRKKLSKNREIAVHVFRGGSQHQISISNVVSGDIVWLKKGDQIPADGLFISSESLKSNDEFESTIDDQNPFMFYGAKVINGEGKMLVVSIGKDTVWGEMMSNVINASNPLQVQLDQLNNCIQIIGVLITIIILVVLFLHFEFSKGSAASVIPDLKAKSAVIKEFIDVIYKIVKNPKGKTDRLTSSLTMILVGIAEGLPLMREVDMLYVSGQFFKNESAIAPKVIEALCKGIAIPILGLKRPLSSMEDSLLSWAYLKLGLKLDILKQECIVVEVKELNFDDEGCGVLMRKDGGSVNSSYWKGSASTILAMCSSYYSSGGVMNVIDEQQRVFFEQLIADMQGKHLKTIAFGYKQTDRATLEETGLILLGLLGLKNSFRKSMEDCIGAGVNIKLVSGCDASELESIALECGLNIPNFRFSGAW
ncbi:Calcium-transporting ATPase 7, plasma membrane-type [Camellia lanceoleosa]|uniref:Calcium-transporting ATPase 7, plasma membrane-type n=1 Tax=Camellia lanceoleosa TaxID=1840588 RepID=A0ACC0GJB0_9ERIC|nr:Calcium-transporting ATPase 7, plasma membrane-type [Camellia lanceoleosa]